MIFVFRIGSLGDSLVSLPALYDIKKRHPSEKIVLITNDPKKNYLSTWNIVQYTDVFDDLLTYDGSRFLSVLRLIQNIRKVKEEKMLYYLPPFRTTQQVKRDKFIFGFLAGIKNIIGLEEAIVKLASRNEKGELLTLEKEYSRLLRIVQGKKEKASISNFSMSTPLLIPSQDDYQKIKELLPQDTANKTLIAIAHGTNMQAKKWDIENFQTLLKSLNQLSDNLLFILVGGNEDYLEGERLKDNVENCINLAGKTSIMNSAALLEQCDLFIGNDTGAMHLASVMGTSVVGIFSARDNPGKWEPYGDKYTILLKKVNCEGCMLMDCVEEEKKCIMMISVNEVLEAAKSNLKHKKVLK